MDYPVAWAADVVLSDGGTVHLRPIRAEDADGIRRLHARLTPETIHRRFFSALRTLPEGLLHKLVNVDYRDRMAIVAELGDELIAVARYDRVDAVAAEVAFVVEDAHQGRGLGTILLEHLAVIARANGIARFVAQTLAENEAMLAVFRSAGYETKRSFSGGVVDVEFPIQPTAESRRLIDERDQHAVAASIRRILCPGSVAVIGASRTPGTIGHELVRNLLASGFTGPIFPVNPRTRSIAGIYAYPNVGSIPSSVDLAVVAVPATGVLSVVEECADAGVAGLVVISAGFAELGPDGREVERQVVRLARRNGMRLIGPNCMGIANTDPTIRLNATFSPTVPSEGNVGVLSQSGALGIALMAESENRGLGLSTFVSVGNKADVSGNDLLQFWESDARTEVIALYLESFGNPRRFTQIARRTARSKPIVAVKSGRSAAGARAARSHSAALTSADAVAEVVLRCSGVTRVDTLEEFFDTAQAFAHQPLPSGRRVAIVGNAGGPGILAADAVEAMGLELPELSPATQAALRKFLPAAAAVLNPVDIVASTEPASFELALRTVLDDDGIDAVIAIYVPPLPGRDAAMTAAIAAAAAAHRAKPVLANVLTGPTAIEGNGVRVPVYRFPESAVRALAHMAARTAWLARGEGTVPPVEGLDIERVRATVAACLEAEPAGGWLDPAAAEELAVAAGLPLVTTKAAATVDEAVRAADLLGYPVAVKGTGAALLHKTEMGAVHLDVADAGGVRQVVAEMQARLGDRLEGIVVQPMVPAGVELIAGVSTDPAFGPLVLLGAGGTAAELLRDRVLSAAPVTDIDAAEMVRGMRTSPLLFGYRNTPVVDTAAVESLLVRIGTLVDRVPEIVELDLNPVIASPVGVTAVDLRVRVEPHVPHPERALRRLR